MDEWSKIATGSSAGSNTNPVRQLRPCRHNSSEQDKAAIIRESGRELGNSLLGSVGLRLAIAIVTLAAGVYLIQGISDLFSVLFDVLILIFLAWILSAAVRRLANFVEVYVPQPTWAAVPIAYLIILLPVIALIGLLVPLTISQTVTLSEDLPDFAVRLSGFMSSINEFFDSLRAAGGGEETVTTDPLLAFSSTASAWVQDNALGIVGSTTNILIQTIFCISLSFYMTIERDQLRGLFYRLLPVEYHDRASVVLAHLDRTFFSYLKGISIVVVLYSAAITITMLAAGLPFALPIGITAGLVQLVPIIGEVAAIGIPITIALLTGSVTTAIMVAVALISWSLFMNNFVLPRVYGRAVRMPGFFVLLAVVIGTRFAGPWGAMLGVPVAGFIYSLIFAWGELRQNHDAEAGDPSVEEEETTEENTAPEEAIESSDASVTAGNGRVRVNGDGTRPRTTERILATIRSMLSR